MPPYFVMIRSAEILEREAQSSGGGRAPRVHGEVEKAFKGLGGVKFGPDVGLRDAEIGVALA